MHFREHIKTRKEKFGAVIFDTLKEKVYVTNNTGRDILNLIEEKKSPEEIHKTLEKKYSTDENTEVDIKKFIKSLITNNLVGENE